jgi:uncharacterized protein YlbG (UPF0298 family)
MNKIIYKNIGLDNIRKKEKKINTFGDVCWFFRSFRHCILHCQNYNKYQYVAGKIKYMTTLHNIRLQLGFRNIGNNRLIYLSDIQT